MQKQTKKSIDSKKWKKMSAVQIFPKKFIKQINQSQYLYTFRIYCYAMILVVCVDTFL